MRDEEPVNGDDVIYLIVILVFGIPLALFMWLS
jgi:hypothetical protein